VQIFVAYAFDSATEPGSLRARLARVDEHFRDLWGDEVVQDGRDVDSAAPQLGIHVWHPAKPRSRWPAWQVAGNRQVATAYPPVGYERIIGDVSPEESPVRLAAELAQRPERVRDLVAPFAMAALDTAARRLTVVNDAVGLGRVHELRFTEGWVWSNRPVAACLFAGIRVRADRRGWRHFACTNGFMDDAGPYERVTYLPAGTRITCEQGRPRRAERCADGMSSWVGGRGAGLSESVLDDVSGSLQQVARSVARLWDGPILADLSGGRDSRVVVASLLSLDLDVRLNTNGALAGEADTAERLVALLGKDVEHRISRPTAGPTAGPGVGPAPGPAAVLETRRDGAIERTLRWFRYADAMRPATYLPAEPPGTFAMVDEPHTSGAVGEVAHGHAYPSDFVDLARLDHQARIDRCERQLLAAVGPIHGSSQAARDTVCERIRTVLREAASAGVADATLLDYFWLAERLRRWGTAAERPGIVVPLADPQFLQAAFKMTPEERRASALHRALLGRLVPQWAEIPFFKPGPQDVRKVVRTHVWQEPERDLITSIVMTPETWEDAFAPSEVQRAWRTALAGMASPRDEHLLQRVVWRAVFEDHLAALNGEKASVRTPMRSMPLVAGEKGAVASPVAQPPADAVGAAVLTPSAPRTAPQTSVAWRTRNFTARALRKAAAMVAPARSPRS
jgi:hypothetical protein